VINTTVIIPYKNNLDALQRALESVLAQTVKVSVIVIDDGSDIDQRAEITVKKLIVSMFL
jgi:Glycosyl transferase family 2.